MQTRHGKSSDMVARSMALIGSIGVAKKRRSIPILSEKERYFSGSSFCASRPTSHNGRSDHSSRCLNMTDVGKL